MILRLVLLASAASRTPFRGRSGARVSVQQPLRSTSLAETPRADNIRAAASAQPLALAAAQAGALRCLGDRVAQELHFDRGDLASINIQHIAAMGLVGVLSGSGGFLWLNHLERMLGESKGAADVLRKSALDFLCWAPVANCMYLFGVPLLTGAPSDAAALNMQTQVGRALPRSIFRATITMGARWRAHPELRPSPPSPLSVSPDDGRGAEHLLPVQHVCLLAHPAAREAREHSRRQPHLHGGDRRALLKPPSACILYQLAGRARLTGRPGRTMYAPGAYSGGVYNSCHPRLYRLTACTLYWQHHLTLANAARESAPR